MEFRKERDTDDPNDSCTSYNRRNLYLLAKERDIPIAKFEARHDGVAQEEGKHLAEELFGGLVNEMSSAKMLPFYLLPTFGFLLD